MSDRDSIYIEWGRFKAGATGKFAITAFVLVVASVTAARLFGWW
jgi:hypothetical protein